MSLRFKAIVPAFVVLVTATAHGSLVVDQSYIPPWPALSSHAFHDASDAKYNEAAETFTVGITGTLSEVDLLLHEDVQSQDLAVRILQTNADGTPRTDADAVLAAEVVPATAFPNASTFIPVPLQANSLLNVIAGQVLAIEVSPAQDQDFTGAVGDWWDGDFSTTKQFPYSGGQAFERGTITNDQWQTVYALPGPAALGFKTYVTPAPEPGPISLVVISAATLLLRRRRNPLMRDAG